MKSVYSKYLCEGSEYETYKEFRDVETAGYEMDKLLSSIEFLMFRIKKIFEKNNIDITEPVIKDDEVQFKLKNYTDEENEKAERILFDMRDIAWGPLSGDFNDMTKGYGVSLDLDED